MPEWIEIETKVRAIAREEAEKVERIDDERVHSIAKYEIQIALTPIQSQIASVGANLRALYNPDFTEPDHGIPGAIQLWLMEFRKAFAGLVEMKQEEMRRLTAVEQSNRDREAAEKAAKEILAADLLELKEKNNKRWTRAMWAVGVIVTLLLALLQQDGCKKKLSNLIQPALHSQTVAPQDAGLPMRLECK